MFFGGYNLKPLPFIPDLPLLGRGRRLDLRGPGLLTVYFTKVVVVICFMMLIRWTIPRLRYDQIMVGGWQMLIPTGMVLAGRHQRAGLPREHRPDRDPHRQSGRRCDGVRRALLFMAGTANKKIPMYGRASAPCPASRVVTRSSERIAIEDRPEHATSLV